MVKLMALYKPAPDQATFDQHYFSTHVPLTAKIPGLQRIKVTRVVGAPMGEAPYYLLCEMYYEDHDSLLAAMKSPEGKASAKDLFSFAGELVTLMIGEELDEEDEQVEERLEA